jgi:ribonuclease HII
VDGNQAIPCRIPSVPVVKGDGRCLSIAASSILAKVVRDQIMEELHKKYPAYGFAFHKGYATAEHKQAIIELGPCPVHRRTFRGVKECI